MTDRKQDFTIVLCVHHEVNRGTKEDGGKKKRIVVLSFTASFQFVCNQRVHRDHLTRAYYIYACILDICMHVCVHTRIPRRRKSVKEKERGREKKKDY